MKKIFLKAITVIALGAVFVVGAYANEYEDDFVLDFNRPLSNFSSVSGEVVEVDGQVITIESETGLVRLNISESVFVGFELEQETTIGQAVTGYFLAHGPVILIYPPLYNVAVLVNPDGEHHSVAVNLFVDMDGRLTSIDNTLVINTENTIIVDHDFEPFDGDLAGRNLVVLYDIATRSIPAIANPELVMVLPVAGIIMPELDPIDIPVIILDPELDLLGELELDDLVGLMPTLPVVNYVPDWNNYPIIVEGVGLYNVDFYMTETEVFVPLRQVVQTMGPAINWNPDTGEIDLDGVIFITPGSNEFRYRDQIITLNSPAILVDHVAHVPISFFRELMGFNNAYFHGGHVHINNDELME